jgi:hypothetical protein
MKKAANRFGGDSKRGRRQRRERQPKFNRQSSHHEVVAKRTGSARVGASKQLTHLSKLRVNDRNAVVFLEA